MTTGCHSSARPPQPSAWRFTWRRHGCMQHIGHTASCSSTRVIITVLALRSLRG
jgi:hypothetical protein